MSELETEANALIERLPLKALGLKSGMALQTRRIAGGATKKESQFFGAIEGKGVMVGPLGAEGADTELAPGDVCVVRGFTGQYEFSFLSKVLQVFAKPFVYALMAYPAEVDARLVRKSMRTKVSWPCSVLLPGEPADHSLQVALVDLSDSGAMVTAASPLGALGGLLQFNIDANLGVSAIQLQLQAKICHNNRAANQDGYVVGMAFTGLTREDRIQLELLTRGAPG